MPPMLGGTNITGNLKPNNDTPKKKKPRPSSLSLTVAGQWLQKGVKSLGTGLGGNSWINPVSSSSNTTPAGRADMPPPAIPSSTLDDVQVPQALQEGTWMTKVSSKKQKKMFLRLDPEMGHIIWHSKQPRIIPIENIKEIRSGSSTRLHRHHFQLAKEYENLWLTLIYILQGHYKILHLIAPSSDILRMWDATLRTLHAHEMHLLTGLGNIEERQRVWEKRYWKGADVDCNQRLSFDEVEKMCRKLNINSPREDLLTWFKQADVRRSQYLDFQDFRRFVKLLKTRNEIIHLFNHLKGSSEFFDFDVFTHFMRRDQKSTLSLSALEVLFEKYSVSISPPAPTSSRATTSPRATISPPTTPHPTKEELDYFGSTGARSSPTQQRTFTPETLTNFLLSPDNAPFASPSHSTLPPKSSDTTPLSSTTPPTPATSSLPLMKHDMTHPLSSYFISSSHNTYLVGHQLVGSSTVEGYIRALLAGCRSVEIDIYDGSGSGDSPLMEDLSTSGSSSSTSPILSEPMVFHGHTLTTKVPLRQVCQAIMKYGFIASPYPIIISAENHCSVQGQEQIARIMIEEFGTALVRYPNDGPDLGNVASPAPSDAIEQGNWKGKAKITQLPSPEELKGRILLKTKNLLVSKLDCVPVTRGTVTSSESDVEPSSSASEGEFGVGSVSTMFGGLYRRESERVGKKAKKSGDGLGGDLVREGFTSMLQRVRSVGRSAAPASSSASSSPPNPPAIPISVHKGTPPPTPNASTTHITSQPLVASPPPFSSSCPSSTIVPSTVPLSIPIRRNQSSMSTGMPLSPFPQPSPASSVSSTSSSIYDNATALSPPSAHIFTPSSQNNSPFGATGGGLTLAKRKSIQRPTVGGISLQKPKPKPKMSMALVALLVYTVGVKCRGLRKSGHIYLHSDESGSFSDAKSSKSIKSKEKSKEGVDERTYAPEHMFSLSENKANKFLKMYMLDLIKHTEERLVRVYPRGTRMSSTNFEPHRYWSAGCQLVAINWQTFDLGYVINHAMFQRNARCGYVLKPPPLRHPSKPEHGPDKWRKKGHQLNITIISAQQLPGIKVKDGSGHEVLDSEKDKEREKEGSDESKAEKERDREGKNVDPYVEVSLHVPEWTCCVSPSLPTSASTSTSMPTSPPSSTYEAASSSPEHPLRFRTSSSITHTSRTPTVKNNGFNPIWNHDIQLSFDAPTQPGMFDLIFLRLLVKQDPSSSGSAKGMNVVGMGMTSEPETLAVCCVSLGEVREGYRHLPLYDATLSQYLFSTLFVKIGVA